MTQTRNGKRILIVEDDVDTQESLRLTLEGEGYTVSVAGNGQEALEQLISTDLPSLILLDLMMPIMDGWEFRKRQRTHPRFSSIPVVAVSAHRPGGNGASLDVAAYLMKPLDLDQLLATIGKVAP